MDFLVWLQQFRSPALNFIVEGITISAEETTILAAICIIYWCINKKAGYIAGLAVVLATCMSSTLKFIFNVPRPWTLDDRIIPIRKHTATDSSFPSGHTMTGVSFWSALMFHIKKKWFTILTIIIIILIAFSRVYLSVHTLVDVSVGMLLAIGIAFLAYLFINSLKDGTLHWSIFALSFVLIVLLFFIKSDTYYKMAGVTLAFLPSFIIESKYIRFNVRCTWWKQLIKIVIGITIAFGIRLGLGAVFPEMLIFDFIRYFLMGIGILILAPWIFIKARLAERV